MSIPEKNRARRKRSRSDSNGVEGASGRRSDGGAAVFNIGSARPFRTYAKQYLEAGWHPIILPEGKKAPPPIGYTGRFDGIADAAQLENWPKERDKSGRLRFGERANLGFRPPVGVLGIDVDNYAGAGGGKQKVGGQSLSELVATYGELPDTWISTARSDGVSGIRWFRVPGDLVWPGKLGKDIESVWHRYRFAVAPPSIHPELKDPYLWYKPGMDLDGSGIAEWLPSPDELPELPTEWVEGLQNGIWEDKPYDLESSRSDLVDWIKARPAGDMCPQMEKAVSDAIEELEGAGSAHETLNTKLYYVIKSSSEGHPGLIRALQQIRQVFVDEVTTRGRAGSVRSKKEAAEEYGRSRDGAIRAILGTLSLEAKERGRDSADGPVSAGLPPECTCYIPSDLDGDARDPADYDRNDRGNAEQLIDMNTGELHFVPALGREAWISWDEESGSWISDAQHIVTQAAISVGRRIQERGKELYKMALLEAKKDAQQSGQDDSDDGLGGGKRSGVNADEDVKAAKELYKWGVNTGNRAKITAMVDLAKSFPGVVIDANKLDQDPYSLATLNGIVDLRTGSVRRGVKEDYITKCCAVEYRAGVKSRLWDKFLRVSVGDPDVIGYLQKLAGVSLLGNNAERLFVFLVGPTGSGKSVFVETIVSVLGDYAGPFPLSLFRDNQDEKPRSDIIAALPRRFVGTAEASRSWSLHADQIKRITGGDRIVARIPHAPVAIERVPAFTPWISSNDVPSISGLDGALRRRLRVARFPRTVVGTRDDVPGLKTRLPDEAGSAVLAWLVDGCVRALRDGLEDVPAAMDQELIEFATEASGHLGDWLNECFERVEGEDSEAAVIPNVEIMRQYQMWCVDNGISDREQVSNVKMGLFLNSQDIPKGVTGGGKKNQRGRVGIAFKVDVPTEFE